MVLSVADLPVMGSCPGVFLRHPGPQAQIPTLPHPTALHGINKHTSVIVPSPHPQIQVSFTQGEDHETQITNRVS